MSQSSLEEEQIHTHSHAHTSPHMVLMWGMTSIRASVVFAKLRHHVPATFKSCNS